MSLLAWPAPTFAAPPAPPRATAAATLSAPVASTDSLSTRRFLDKTRASKGAATADWSAPASGDSLLVVFSAPRNALGRAAFSLGLRTSGSEVRSWDRHASSASVEVPAGEDRAEFAARLAANPTVAWVQPEYRYSATMVPNDPEFGHQWGLSRIGAPFAWDTTSGSSSVKIALLDTGVDLDHPDLVGQIDVLPGSNFITKGTPPQDDDGHGTHVAGILAAATNNGIYTAGTAPGCRIMPVKVLNSAGQGDTSVIADAVRFAADNGAKVISMSLGGTVRDPSFEAAIDYARAKDVVIVAAAGNSGLQPTTAVDYPARYAGVLGVAATNVSDKRASFSTYGEGVDIAAPGEFIWSTALPSASNTNSFVGSMSGTSMSTPFVAGVAALVRSRFTTANAEAVAQHLEATAEDLGAPGWDRQFGFGLLQADIAVNTTPTAPLDIPGFPIPPSPVSASLSTTVASEVYRIEAASGQTIHLSLDTTVTADFALRLFGPDATSVVSASPLLVADSGAYPRTLDYIVPAAGTYFVQVARLSGAAPFSVTWQLVNPPPSADDGVPGVLLPTSPVSGTLDSISDTDDLYRVSLKRGDTFSVQLDGAAATDFDIYLLAPGSTSIASGRVLVSSENPEYPDKMSYTALTNGNYYLDVRAFSGSGSYSAAWNVSSHPDFDIPGVPLPTSPYADNLAAQSDVHDVFYVDLEAGQVLQADLNAAGADFDLVLYGPSATSVYGSIAPVAQSSTRRYPESITYVVPRIGLYYFDIRQVSGSGPYSLSWSASPPPPLGVSRVQGQLRYDVASNLARKGWDPAGDHAWPAVARIVVASGDDRAAADPLAAAGLAGAYDAPILLVRSDPKAALPDGTARVISEIAAAHPGVQITIVGGPSSVPDATWERIRAIAGVSPYKDRIGGADRYDVTANIAARMIDVIGSDEIVGVLIVCAENPNAFYDALAASPIAYSNKMPMLGVRTSKSLSASVSRLLTGRLADKPRYVVSSSTYVSERVRKATGASERLTKSADRYAAASAIAESAIARGWLQPANTGLAAKLPDALSGGAFLGKINGVMLFTDTSRTLKPASATFLSTHRPLVTRGWVLGGPKSVAPQAEVTFRNLLK